MDITSAPILLSTTGSSITLLVESDFVDYPHTDYYTNAVSFESILENFYYNTDERVDVLVS